MKAVLGPILVSLVLYALTSHGAPLADTRIVGGTEAVKKEFPFLVSLRNSANRHFCGGSLIRENWVLTAAHCARAVSASEVRIKIGLHVLTDTRGVETFKAKKVIVHPDYNIKKSFDFDYALIQLNGKSKFTPITLNGKALDLPEEEKKSPLAITAGWGVTRPGGAVSPLLMKVSVPLVNDRRCDLAYPNSITDSMQCAGYDAGGRDSCQGDSGGPLFVKATRRATLTSEWLLLGVVSWGEGCAAPKKYGVYSKVHFVRAWIEAQTRR